jgi:surface polysaccharide O-acyltransferase-like enzyme
MKKRIVSIELLRIIAMMMVVTLHYLDKGGVLPSLTGEMTLNGYVAWGVECLAIVAVNVYMLISGYLLVETGFKPGRLIELLCQVLFYT